MSVPRRKLEVPELPGYHLHWFTGKNVLRAQEAGYEHVRSGELPVNQFNPATDVNVSGSTDLGSNIRLVAGGVGEDGAAEYLHLMKIRLEWWQEDQKMLEDRNASILQAIFRDEKVLGSEQDEAADRDKRYVKKALLNRPPRKISG
ncbi:MAG: hypothetical protein SFV24_19120 [Gemmatimonadales bacterium]|nr:hypothetical protein [Gemmatimonadales bacterium]